MKKKLSIIALLGLTMCSGCNLLSGSGNGLRNEKNEKENTVIEQETDKKEHNYVYDGENLHIDLNIDKKDVTLTGGTAKVVPYTDTVGKVEQKYITEDWSKTVNENYDENGDKENSYEYMLGNGAEMEKYISISPLFYDMLLNADATNKVNAAFRLNGSDNANESLYMKEEKLSFGSISEAVEGAKEQLSEVGVELGELDYQYYVLKETLMKEQEWMVDNNGENVELDIDWGKNDNFYNVYARQSFQGLPVYYTNSDLGIGLSNRSMPIHMLLDENGICAVNMEKVFKFTKGEKAVSLIDVKEIINNIIDIYFEGAFETKYSINQGELMYYAKKVNENQYNMIPVWIFMVEEDDNGESVLSHVLMFDAVTGDEVPTE